MADNRAVMTSSYRFQLGLIAGMLTVWFTWCMYDGYVNYPYQRMVAREYAQFKQEGRVSEWAAYARARGWPDGTAGEPGKDRSDMDIYTQYVMGYGVLPFALIYGVSFVRSFGRWIASDNQGLNTSWGQRVPFDAVTRLNKDRWATKGIAVVQYQDRGRNRKLVLDNFKYSADRISTMVSELESRLSPGQENVCDDAAGTEPRQES